MFILGMLLGSGLVFAGQELQLQWQMYKQRRTQQFNDAVEAAVAQREIDQWGIVRTPDKPWT